MGKAFELGLKYLSLGMKTEGQVRQYLKKKECAEQDIEEAIESLKDYRYLDDNSYCKAYFRMAAGKGKGRRRIEQELGQKGVKREIIMQAFDELDDSEEMVVNEKDRAVQVGEKMLRQHLENGKEVDQKFLAKVGRRLAGLGYSADTVYFVLGKLKGRNYE